MTYTLDVEFETLIDEQAFELLELAKSIAGKVPESQGCGGGCFDLQFDFDTRSECKLIKAKLEDKKYTCEMWELDDNGDLKIIE